ncbi:uncharacterized protein LTHEOB_11429 [Lasiodiplodia theobromae]|uniref:uncharacterized protein n=1 Tax=Lasiodiplodia theobromae TaxID=45133 RepID=UPI0015C2D994|nr:uncharacterized protein LTHEOB_11429 [Lasiodiplodia theobromae]KAF4537805.1 hypothetical protein LTHEOB_11429 [Lasiodiplodia theobromae]
MATTTTTTTTRPRLSAALADYEVRQTVPTAPTTAPHPPSSTGTPLEPQPAAFNPTLAPHPLPYAVMTNPEGWPADTFRRVPSYRPVNRGLDREERRQNAVFTVVGTFMIAGCAMIAGWSSVWRNTFGRGTGWEMHPVGGTF